MTLISYIIKFVELGIMILFRKNFRPEQMFLENLAMVSANILKENYNLICFNFFIYFY